MAVPALHVRAAGYPRPIVYLASPHLVQPVGDAGDFSVSPSSSPTVGTSAVGFHAVSQSSSPIAMGFRRAASSKLGGSHRSLFKNHTQDANDGVKPPKLFKAAVHTIEAAREMQLDPDVKRCYAMDRVVNAHDVTQIDLDLPRTGQGDPLVCSQMGRIRAILLRFVAEDPELGYCQGMSLVAACFAAASRSQSEAFQRFDAFIQSVRGLWLPGFPLLQEALGQFSFVAQSRPWFGHMLAHEVEPSMYLPQALMTLLAMWLPLSTIVRFIDVLEHEGLAGLLAASIAVLDLLGPCIQSLKSMEDILVFMKDLRHGTPHPDDVVLKLRRVLPDTVAKCAQARRMPSEDLLPVRIERKGSEVINDDGEHVFSSISQALTRALEETEAAGQKVLKWAEEETASVGGSLFRWSLSGMSTAFTDITAPLARKAPGAARRAGMTLTL